MTLNSEKKHRLSVYLEPYLKRRLADFANRREQSTSLIAEAAIASFLSPDADDRKEAAIVKRLDRIDSQCQRLERDLGITNETLALFIRFWLNSTVPLPEESQVAARRKGEERYGYFLRALGRRISKGENLGAEISNAGFRDEHR